MELSETLKAIEESKDIKQLKSFTNIDELFEYLDENIKDMPPEYIKMVDKYFWDLI